MAAGGPGDHWRSDLLTHGIRAFGEPCDSLIVEIHRLGGRAYLDDETDLGKRLWEQQAQWNNASQDALAGLADELRRLRDDLAR